ncbi:hypothetical protein FXO38_11228 [Capsicum annuum]|nr:hypothetical protein FXO38_11228 [Capsicum annuum]
MRREEVDTRRNKTEVSSFIDDTRSRAIARDVSPPTTSGMEDGIAKLALVTSVKAMAAFFSMMGSNNQDEDDTIAGVAATSVLAAGVAIIIAYEHKSSIPREPYVNKDQEREFYMNSILNGNDVHCVGQIRISAIDATHVLAFVPIEQQNRFRGRKGTTTQNVLTAINFNLKFLYVLAGWEGSAHDFRDTIWSSNSVRKKGEKQFRWSKPMEYLMLEILADGVKQENKSTNQFKTSSFNRVLNAINEQLGMDCSSKHVENHLKTIRNTWITIQILLNKSGLGWDDNLKIITDSPEVYAVHIQAHSNYDKFINKKIKIFDEMSLVCRNNRAREDCAKSFEDIDFDSFSEKDNDNDVEGPSIEKGCAMTTTIGRMVDSRLDVIKLYEDVMAMEGYSEEFLGDAFDYLVQSDTLAKAFMVKNQNLRKV